MHKIKEGQKGDLTALSFEMIFMPDKPEVFLMDFLHSKKEQIGMRAYLENGDIAVTMITRELAIKLLREFGQIYHEQ